MSCTPPQISACGRWELVRSETGAPPDPHVGYGSQRWTYELIVRATGEVWTSWSGSASQTPWSADSHGIARVSWDGDTLVIEHCADHEAPQVDRVLPASLPKSIVDSAED